jgi:hypothetical protein
MFKAILLKVQNASQKTSILLSKSHPAAFVPLFEKEGLGEIF